jgi:RNA polymerase sigma-70 factor (ECF subfamily)
MQAMKQRESRPDPAAGRAHDRDRDRTLVDRLAQADVAALEEVYELYSARLFALCLRMMRDHARAEEVLQDTFWQLWSGPERFDAERGALITYLMQIARTRCLDRLRFEQRRGSGSLVSEAVLELRDFGASGPTPFQSALSAEERGRVRAALDELPDAYRDTLLLAYFDGLTQSEIAESTRTPLGTVKTRVRRALMRLREILQPEDES